MPGALLAALLVMFPVHWVVMLIHAFGGYGDSFITVDDKNLLAAIPSKTLEGFGNALFVPLAFIVAGSRIAPTFRRVTAISLAVLLVAALAICTTQLRALDYLFDDGWVHLIFTVVLILGGVFYGVFQAHEADKNA